MPAEGYPQAGIGAFFGPVLREEAYVKRLYGCVWLSYPQAEITGLAGSASPKTQKAPLLELG